MPEMMDSGIEWIKEIPFDWDISPLKYNYHLIAGATPDSSNMALWDGNVNWITPADFKTKDIFVSEGARKLSEMGYKSCSTSMVPAGSIIFSKRAPIGSVAISTQELCTNQGCLSLVAKNNAVNNKYYYYVLSIYDDVFNLYGSGTTFKEISATVFGNVMLPYPNRDLQNKIVAFLDSKCAEIDFLLSDIQSEIETLEEYKKSAITEAVTKGLNPDVKMKDSGIEYVGYIPSSWEIHPVYYYFGERKAKNYALKEQNLLSLSYGKIIRKDINTNGGLLPASFNTYNIVESGDIIIRPTDLQNDKRSLRTGLVTEHGIITSAYIDLMPIADINSEYFHYLLHAFDVMKVFYNMGNGVRQGLNYSEFSKLMIFAPSRKEQDDIVAYLKDTCTAIEELIALKKEQLETLEEYKKSVIYEYVTGKKEVV